MIAIQLVYDPATGRLVYDPATGRLVCGGRGTLEVASLRYSKLGATPAAMEATAWSTTFFAVANDHPWAGNYCSLLGWDLDTVITTGTDVGSIIFNSGATLRSGNGWIVGWRFADSATPDDAWSWVTGMNNTTFTSGGCKVLSVRTASQRYLWVVYRIQNYTGTNSDAHVGHYDVVITI